MGSVLMMEYIATTIRFVLEEEYIGVMKDKLDDVFRSGGSSIGVNRVEKTEREMRISFIVTFLVLSRFIDCLTMPAGIIERS